MSQISARMDVARLQDQDKTGALSLTDFGNGG